MKYLLLSLLLVFSSAVFAQVDTLSEITQQIDTQIWVPFKESYEAHDSEKFNNLHTDDVLRVSSWGIRIGDEYKNSIIKSNARENKPAKVIDFKFEHRIHSDSIAYEVGYYRVTYSRPDQEDEYHFGRFHVVIKKIKGVWKISQDWDTDKVNGVPVTAEDFGKN